MFVLVSVVDWIRLVDEVGFNSEELFGVAEFDLRTILPSIDLMREVDIIVPCLDELGTAPTPPLVAVLESNIRFNLMAPSLTSNGCCFEYVPLFVRRPPVPANDDCFCCCAESLLIVGGVL